MFKAHTLSYCDKLLLLEAHIFIFHCESVGSLRLGTVFYSIISSVSCTLLTFNNELPSVFPFNRSLLLAMPKAKVQPQS